jgi:plastocyanin
MAPVPAPAPTGPAAGREHPPLPPSVTVPRDACVVHIHGHRYIPPCVEVCEGQLVCWFNHDPEPHTVTFPGGADLVLGPGELKCLAVPLPPGMHPYHCRFHPAMRGAVRVLPHGPHCPLCRPCDGPIPDAAPR